MEMTLVGGVGGGDPSLVPLRTCIRTLACDKLSLYLVARRSQRRDATEHCFKFPKNFLP